MNTRTLLVFSFLFVSYLLWQAWMDDRARALRPDDGPTSAAAIAPNDTAADVPAASPAAPGNASTEESRPASLPPRELIEVETDVLRLKLDPLGGSIVYAELPHYPVAADRPDQPFVLLDRSPELFYVSQNGLVSADGEAPSHKALFESPQTRYVLGDEQTLVVELLWRGDGLEVVKRFRFERGSYLIHAEQLVRNHGERARSVSAYQQFQRTAPKPYDTFSYSDTSRYSFVGAGIYNPEDHFTKLPLDEMAEEPLKASFSHGWGAMLQLHFFTAWIPPAEEVWHYSTRVIPGAEPRYLLTEVSPARMLAPGEETVFQSRLFAGPKLQNELPQIAEGLELVVDYGMFTIFAKPLFHVLDFFHGLVGNWGWAIVLLTLSLKLLFFKLSEAQYRSMARMRKMQPRIEAIKQRYADDRQRLNEAMMKLYKEEKINPLGGCLPILVQIPVFIALYWVLLESVELRQAHFILWLQDLSSPDPYYVLPALNGLFMYLTQKLSPQMSSDPMQQKIMNAMPLVFSVMFAFFQSGLVLYWTVNSGLSLLQQWVITRRLEQQNA